MTLDDLLKAFLAGKAEEAASADYHGGQTRSGIRAVVLALRDEMGFDYNECGDCTRNDRLFDDILGDAGEKKPDAAPAVCVWTGEEYVTHSTSCESEHEVDPHKAPPTHCPFCGKPIKFTEAK